MDYLGEFQIQSHASLIRGKQRNLIQTEEEVEIGEIQPQPRNNDNRQKLEEARNGFFLGAS